MAAAARHRRAARPGPPQDRHRVVPQRRAAGRLARAVRGGRRGGGGRGARGGRGLVALRRRRRARRTPRSRLSWRRSTAAYAAGPGRRAGAERCGIWPTRPAALIVPAARFDLVRVGHRGVRDRPGARGRRAGRRQPAAGDAAAGPAGQRQAASRPGPASPTAGPGSPTGRPRSAWCRWATRDGIPRQAGNWPRSAGGGRRAPVRGRICMDQFVVDLGPGATAAASGTRSCVFGPRARRRADRGRTGPGVRHDRLRDRHPDRRPRAPPLRAEPTESMAGGVPTARRVAAGGWVWSAGGRRAWRPAVSPPGWSWSGGSSQADPPRRSPHDDEPIFSRSARPGPPVTTPDGVVLHTEIDEPDDVRAT